ncbi:MAG TPA: hypothetical protein VEW42_02210 [Candidatus Eisenbacteria bacterium]|nr:hypothetical protein [Candidatus Eisenbacteria bacterium]
MGIGNRIDSNFTNPERLRQNGEPLADARRRYLANTTPRNGLYPGERKSLPADDPRRVEIRSTILDRRRRIALQLGVKLPEDQK